MTEENYLSFLQQLLTMTDSSDRVSVIRAESILLNLFEIMRNTENTNPVVTRMVMLTIRQFRYLLDHAKDFTGKPGEYKLNAEKRRRLALVIEPGC